MKFKVGDIVKADSIADGKYNFTNHNKGWTGKVICAKGNCFNAETLSGLGSRIGEEYCELNYEYFSKGGTMPKTLYNLEIGDIVIDDDGDEQKILAVLATGENPVYLLSDYNDFDEADDMQTAKELERKDYTFPGEQTELTMDQIADKFGVSVEQLKIKKD